MQPDVAELLTFYGRMALIRRAEERLAKLFADGEVPGFVHLSTGQEAVPVGICAALADADTVASPHRGHGHALAKGMALDGEEGIDIPVPTRTVHVNATSGTRENGTESA